MPQTQTPNIFSKPGRMRDYSPAADTYAGDIVVIGKNVFLATNDIAASATSALGLLGVPVGGALHCDGVWRVNKDSSVFADGDVVHWQAAGTPVVGAATTGAASATSAGGVVMGRAVGAALTGDQYVNVLVEPSPHNGAQTQTVAAAGSAQGDAGAITVTGPTSVVLATGADATKGVVLPAPVAGQIVVVKNRDSDNAILKVYPATGGTINALAANGALSMAAKTSAVFVAFSATQWYTVPLLPS